jgi:hypothetical protein
MIEIPDNVRQMLAIIRKYHFWILAALVPLILFPLLSLGNSDLQTRITAQQRAIEGKRGQVRSVTGVSPHPNQQWSETIEAQANQVGDETRREWQRLWDSQEPLRVWPAELGPEFLAAVKALRPGERLDRPALLNYQRRVQRFARALAPRMGVPDEMGENQPGGGQPAGGPRAEGPRGEGQPAAPRPPYTWNAADQQRLWKTFSWGRPPSTEQVLLAQQELWVYGQFCDLIREFNTGLTGPHDAAIASIELLAVGYPAAEDAPGGRGTNRIVVPPPPRTASGERGGFGEPGGEFGEPPPDAAFAEGDTAGPVEQFVRPAHARFTDSRDAADSLPEDQWNWAYVDFAGQPLMADELAAAPGVDMVRLMPFMLRVVMDQRQLDRLLVALAQWPLPIDVRQVRINPGSEATQGGGRRGFDDRERRGSQGGGGPAGQPGDPGVPRRYDVVVELRGSVALATPPGSTPATAAADATPSAEAF